MISIGGGIVAQPLMVSGHYLKTQLSLQSTQIPHFLALELTTKKTYWLIGTWPGKKPIIFDSECGHVLSHPTGDLDYFDNINVLELWPVVLSIKRGGLAIFVAKM